MTSDRIEELQAQFKAMSRRVDDWCIYQGNSRTKKGMETVEERARHELGMVKEGETLYQLAE